VYARAGILSALEHLQAMVGRIALIPLKLTRAPQAMTHKGTKRTHYILTFSPTLTYQQIAELRTTNPTKLPMLEPPKDEDPETDPVDVIKPDGGVDAAALADMSDEQMDKVQKALTDRTAKPAVASTAKTDAMERWQPKADGFDLRFDEVLALIAEDKTLTEIKAAVIVDMKIKGVAKLTEPGKKEFVKRFRFFAKDRGLDKLPF
jgi:hypothetical protein